MGSDPLDPDQIGPDTSPKQSFGQKLGAVPRRVVRAFSTKEGLLGDYDYAFLFKPNIPYLTKKSKRAAPFFGLNDKMPIVLALVLGFQHALSMLAGVITPPIIIAGQGGANFDGETAQYLVSYYVFTEKLCSRLPNRFGSVCLCHCVTNRILLQNMPYMGTLTLAQAKI